MAVQATLFESQHEAQKLFISLRHLSGPPGRDPCSPLNVAPGLTLDIAPRVVHRYTLGARQTLALGSRHDFLLDGSAPRPLDVAEVGFGE